MQEPPPPVQIYVALLDEEVDVWRPVDALPVGPGEYRIVSHNLDPEDEHWEFQQGEVVRCYPKTFSGGVQGLVAVERRRNPV